MRKILDNMVDSKPFLLLTLGVLVYLAINLIFILYAEYNKN